LLAALTHEVLDYLSGVALRIGTDILRRDTMIGS
jgi:hypothetical protein